MFTEFEKQLIKQNPNIKKELFESLVVDFNNDDRYNKNDENIVSKELIKKIVNNKNLYEKLIFLFKTQKDYININFIKDGKIANYAVVSKSAFISEINNLSKDKKSNKAEKERLNNLISIVDFNKQKDTLLSGDFECEIGRKKVVVEKKNLFKILTCPQKEYDEFFDDKNKDEKYFNLDKKEYLYVLKRFLDEEKIVDRYALPSMVLKRYKEITKMDKLDFEAVGCYLTNEVDSEFLEKVIINNNLKTSVLKDMPKSFTPLEKAIYVYIKMCDTLTYDEKFYVSGQFGKFANLHQDMGRLHTIDKNNNKVVCYDFNALYAKFLSEMGVDLAINSAGLENEFGAGHANLTFKIDKFIVNADATNSIIKNDMFLSKINSGVFGLVCKNKSQKSCEAFNKTLKNVYTFVKINEIQKNKNNKVLNFDDCISDYHNIFENKKQEEMFKDNLCAMMSNLNNKNLNEGETMFYLLKLKKMIFDCKEKSPKVDIVVLKENLENEDISSSAVLTLSEDIKNREKENYYYLFDLKNKKWNPVSKDCLKQKLESRNLEYVGCCPPYIPELERKEDYDEDFKPIITFGE